MLDPAAMLTVRQAAERLQVSTRWVRMRCASGEIRAVRLAGDGPWRIFPDGLSKVLLEKSPRPNQMDRSEAYRAMARLGLQPHAPTGQT